MQSIRIYFWFQAQPISGRDMDALVDDCPMDMGTRTDDDSVHKHGFANFSLAANLDPRR